MKLIIRAPNWVGDAVMALPAIDIARDISGADHVAIMARRTALAVFANHPDIDRVVTIDDRGSRIGGTWRAAWAIKDDHYDVGVILPPSFSSAMIFKLAGVSGRIGYAGDARSILLTRVVKPGAEKMHRAQTYIHLFEQLTSRKGVFKNPSMYLSHEDIAAGEKILAEHALSYDSAYAVISPRAVAESRRWGSDRYGQLAARIVTGVDCVVILLGTTADAEAGEEVRRQAPDKIINLCGKTSLPEAAAIASFARLFIGNDSGLAHLAGAVGCPVVVLSGPDDPLETSPLCEKKTVIIKELDCISCVKNRCPKSGDAFMRCMKLISVDEVFDAATKLYRY
jgi:lipopolysaccharide heptosyltransferase II